MPFLGIGAASIVLVLAMVCLAVFAALTLSSAKGDHTLSKKNLERTSAFYQHPMQRMNKLERSMRNYGSCIADLRIKRYMERVGRLFTKSKGISYNKKEKTIAFQEVSQTHSSYL